MTNLDQTDRTDQGTSVGKALSLLAAVGDEVGATGVTTLARKTGIAKSTAFRLLTVLEESGLVERDGTGYRIGIRTFEIGNQVRYCQPAGLRDTALPHLVELGRRTQLTVHLAVRHGWDVLYLEKLPGRESGSVPSRIGERADAHCTALGKAMLAFPSDCGLPPLTRRSLPQHTRYTIADVEVLVEQLQRIQADGFAVDREESILGLECVSAPIFNGNGRVIAAVSVSGRSWSDGVGRHVAAVTASADAISRDLT